MIKVRLMQIIYNSMFYNDHNITTYIMADLALAFPRKLGALFIRYAW